MFEKTLKVLSEDEPKWIIDSRKKALKILQKFPKQEFKESPTQKSYTSQETDFSSMNLKKMEPLKINVRDNDIVSLINAIGKSGLVFLEFDQALKKHEKLIKKYFMKSIKPTESIHAAANCAFRNTGKFIYVPKNANVSIPIALKQEYNEEVFSYVMIILDENSSLDLVDIFRTNDSKYANMIVEIFLSSGAKMNYYSMQDIDKNDFGFFSRKSTGKSDSLMNFVIGNFGSKTLISSTKTVMVEEGAEGNIFDLFRTIGSQHMDITSDTIHNSPKTFSKILSKGIGLDTSSSVFRGMIFMDSNASQCISNLQHHALLLDETAKANAIPGLEIKTNDVQAKHGSAIGHVDDDHIFYLMSRGLTKEEAKKLIVDGYFEPVLVNIKSNEIQEKFKVLVDA